MSEKRDCMLVVDLEATCWRGPAPEGMANEIIEIGLAVVDGRTKNIIETDSLIIKPEYSTLSPFCTELTSLTEEYVQEHGIPFRDAVDILINKYKSKPRIWCSWGKYDYNQFRKDCAKKGVPFPFSENHYNLKPLFSFKHGINKDLGVSSALDHLKMPFEGTHHRGVDDAINIARLLKTMF